MLVEQLGHAHLFVVLRECHLEVIGFTYGIALILQVLVDLDRVLYISVLVDFLHVPQVVDTQLLLVLETLH